MGKITDPFNIRQRLSHQRQQQLFRQRRPLKGKGNSLESGGRRMLNFCSNDYLGLSAHSKLQDAVKEAMAVYGVGSGASHLVTGHSYIHHELEERLAAWVNRPRALLFSTGYMANLGVLSALAQRGDCIIQD